MLGRIVSLNLSRAKTVDYKGQGVTTGIFKTPVDDPVALSPTGFDGDEQAEPRFHGGVHKAVYAYPLRHYEYWSRKLGRPLSPGTFGENLTIANLDETIVRIGDVFRVGDTVLQVSEPRIPCFKLAMRMQAGNDFSTRFLASGRTGFYLRVLQIGQIAQYDSVELQRSPAASPTVLEFLAATHWSGRTPQRVRRAAQAVGLSPEWRKRLDTMLSQTLTAALGNPQGTAKLMVDAVQQETPKVRSVFLIPTGDDPLPRHLAGQFLPLHLSAVDGKPVKRSYSISSPPGSARLRLTVRLEQTPDGCAGKGSGLIHALRPGDSVQANAPAGAFHIDPDDQSDLLLFGAGMGITPLAAITRDAATRGRKIRLGLTAKRRADMPLLTDLEALAQTNPDVSLSLVETGETPDAPRLSAATLGTPAPGARALLCGPPGFVRDIRQGLVALGMPDWRIVSETFNPDRAPTAAGPEMPVQFHEMARAAMNSGETLLETAEAAGICPPAGCRAGSCGICVSKLLTGKVTYLEPVTPRAEDLVHICVAAPDGPVTLGPLGQGNAQAEMPHWKEKDIDQFFDPPA